uniref:Phospholipid scramblase n=1 Tax=Drosophila melanogaster TaxID=7227 RepID=Q8SZE1_DROME|nr:RE03306p [Drosophila melanogaster]
MMQMSEYKVLPQNAPQDENGAVVLQPQAANVGNNANGPENWMSIPVGMPNCPQGLEYLTALDQLLVSQKIEKLELLTGFETKNRFKVKNSLGQNVYFAYEESDCCTRNMLGRSRPFEMKILDNFQNEVLHLYRPFKCDILCCFPSCMNAVEVSAPPGQVIGSVSGLHLHAAQVQHQEHMRRYRPADRGTRLSLQVLQRYQLQGIERQQRGDRQNQQTMVRTGKGAVHRCGLLQRHLPPESGCPHEGAHIRSALFD